MYKASALFLDFSQSGQVAKNRHRVGMVSTDGLPQAGQGLAVEGRSLRVLALGLQHGRKVGRRPKSQCVTRA